MRNVALSALLISLIAVGRAAAILAHAPSSLSRPQQAESCQAVWMSGNDATILGQSTDAVAGRVSDADGSPIPSIFVTASAYATATQCQPSSGAATETDGQGRYRIDLPPGAYLVYVNSHGYTPLSTCPKPIPTSTVGRASPKKKESP
ncbi:MAG: carboxypeptidase regulatory-like domain-containing protein [Chloroflexi bacterium]|nr:carboxypeptidase regulatory-like domain-containing protein [Chloroflexota bacterium]